MGPLKLINGFIIPESAISVSYTRNLDTEVDAAQGAKERASLVELRIDLRELPAFEDEQIERLKIHPEVTYDRRGIVRVSCGAFSSRQKNLEVARAIVVRALRQAMDDAMPDPEPDPWSLRRRSGAGLRKRKPDGK